MGDGGTIRELGIIFSHKRPVWTAATAQTRPLHTGGIVAFNVCNGNPNQNWVG